MTVIDIATERSIGIVQCLTADTTATTTANTNYVDLSADVVQVIDGTVRIEAEDALLTRMTLDMFYAADPGEDTTGQPSHYALGGNGGLIRMYLRNTPDEVYTIGFQAKTIPQEDTISGFVNFAHGLILAGSIAQSLDMLGLNSALWWIRYNDKLANFRQTQTGHSGPRHLKTRRRTGRYRAPELRANI